MRKYRETNEGRSLKDWFGAIGLLLGVLGIAASYYFYALSVKDKSLSVVMDGEITPIIETTKVQSNKFSVVDTDGKKIEGNISAFKVKIINDGDLPIWKKDILVPLEITFYKAVTINGGTHLRSISVLDYFITGNSRKLIIKPKIEIGTDKMHLTKNKDIKWLNTKFLIDFSILENDDEIVMTIVFLGSEVPSYYVFEGAIEGIKKIETNANDIFRIPSL